MRDDHAAKPLLKIKDLAQALGVDRRTIYNWLMAGTCPVQPITGMKPAKFRRTDVEAFLAAREGAAE